MPPSVPAPCVSSPDGDARAGDTEPPIGLSLDVVHEGGEWGSFADAAAIVTAAGAALSQELGIRGGLACVALSSDAHVAKLNADYRGKPQPTNVLSFPASREPLEAAARATLLGDVVLASETVAHEAANMGLPKEHHLQHLVVHGLLHLLGFNHETDEEARAMEAVEARTLARLGLENPYADEPA